MDKQSLQYIKNNQLATIEQPYNAIVKVEPVGLGEYTFNNSAYASINETTVTKIHDDIIGETFIANLVGESDKIMNFEITLAIDSSEFISNSMDTSIVLTKRYISSLSDNPINSTLTCDYNFNGDTNSVTVDTDGSTYLECCISIIDAINEQLQTVSIKYNIVVINGSGMLKIIIPSNTTLTLYFDDENISYDNGYIYNNNNLESQVQDVMSVLLDVNNTNNVINYSTLNDGSLLYISLTNYFQSDNTKYYTTIVQTTTVI